MTDVHLTERDSSECVRVWCTYLWSGEPGTPGTPGTSIFTADIAAGHSVETGVSLVPGTGFVPGTKPGTRANYRGLRSSTGPDGHRRISSAIRARTLRVTFDECRSSRRSSGWSPESPVLPTVRVGGVNHAAPRTTQRRRSENHATNHGNHAGSDVRQAATELLDRLTRSIEPSKSKDSS